jgi:uncharacterized protein YkwD
LSTVLSLAPEKIMKGCALSVALFVSLTALAQQPVKLSEDEQAIIDLTNKEREKAKLPPLKMNPLLTKIARAHTENMIKQKKFAHVLDGKGPEQRAKEGGYKSLVAENCGGSIKFKNGGDLVPLWMGSSGHRANILSKACVEIGVGFGKGPDGWIYATQLFGLNLGKK